MSDMLFCEFQSSLDEVCDYFEECRANYMECAETIVLEGGPYVRQRLQYLNEQAEVKEKKGLKAILDKFAQFIDKLIMKISEMMHNIRVQKIRKRLEKDNTLQQLKVELPNPKKFEKYISLRTKAAEKVIARMKKYYGHIHLEDFDKEVDEEFEKIERNKSKIIGNIQAIPIGLMTWVFSTNFNPFKSKYDKYIKDAQHFRNMEVTGQGNTSDNRYNRDYNRELAGRQEGYSDAFGLNVGIISQRIFAKIFSELSYTANQEIVYKMTAAKAIDHAVILKHPEMDILSDGRHYI